MTLELAAAYWALDQLPGEQLPDIAIQALAEGRDGPALRELAGLDQPTKRDAGDLFERVISEQGLQPLSKREAGFRIAKEIAKQIVSGQMDPYGGARKIWWDIWNKCDRPDELTVFVGAADGYEDEPEHRDAYRQDIIDAAKRLLDSE